MSSRPTVLASALSIRNLLVGAVCIATWRMILVTVGVYSVANQRAAYLLRCLIALNSCALVVGLIQFVLLKGVLAWRAVALFWLLGLILMLLLRTLLLVFDRPAAIGPSPGS